MIKLGLVGDYNAGLVAHQAIPAAIQLAADELGTAVTFEWMPTSEITDKSDLAAFDGLWCVPGSPYNSMEGALLAIQFAREAGRPFLGTCGGFQHAVIEYARNVLGWADAQHAETSPGAGRQVIAALSCGLVEVTDLIVLKPGSRIELAYRRTPIREGYHCRYGLNPKFLKQLTTGDLQIAATDPAGDVRAFELRDHPFFVATLFQPERAALDRVCPPLVSAFIQASGTPASVASDASDGSAAG